MSAPIIIRQGSSPLTRGKRLTESLLPLVHRLIPAHAGKTVLGMDYISQPWAHPRSRGENVHSRVTPHAHAGSSPLTRGKPGVESKARDLLRLIPAHAGKTSCSRCVILAGRAHPRSRGENFSLPWCCSAPYGSSPLTRGKRRPRVVATSVTGLIPAHAGKTVDVLPQQSMQPAHPRSRGENLRLIAGMGPQLGSSPLTRGKRLYERRGRYAAGLIPAHAGKTIPRRQTPLPNRAHPRSRGENRARASSPRHSMGSSPLTRGKPTPSLPRESPAGLIPAHAGKTTQLAATHAGSPAHPRSRGENRNGRDRERLPDGSSPLTRGKPSRAR